MVFPVWGTVGSREDLDISRHINFISFPHLIASQPFWLKTFHQHFSVLWNVLTTSDWVERHMLEHTASTLECSDGIAAECSPTWCALQWSGVVWMLITLDGRKCIMPKYFIDSDLRGGTFSHWIWPLALSSHPIAPVAQHWLDLTSAMASVVVETKLDDGGRYIQSPMKFKASVSQCAFIGTR